MTEKIEKNLGVKLPKKIKLSVQNNQTDCRFTIFKQTCRKCSYQRHQQTNLYSVKKATNYAFAMILWFFKGDN